MPRALPVAVAVAALLQVGPACAQEAASATHPGELRSYATLHSLGFEWDLAGDADHDATCRVRYRVAGQPDSQPDAQPAWQPAMDLLRVDFRGFFAGQVADRHYNMLAGSVLFLEPGTRYEVELELGDPDGGGQRRRLEVATRPAPAPPAGDDIVYVHADSASGDGSRKHPLSFAVALDRVRPGRVHCLLPGRYPEARLQAAGRPGAPVAWLGPQAARRAGHRVPEGRALFPRLAVAADHLWLEGLTFERGAWPDSVIRGALRGEGDATGVVVRGNHFEGYAYSIWLHADNRAWVISDNTIVGGKDIEQEGSAGYSGEGIELQHSEGHTVAYNAITRVADGISYAQRNVDIFGNDIWDTSDDGIEPDYGYANIRMWDNRIANVQYHAFSFQGMFAGPWYFVRNQVHTARGAVFKFRVMDRVVVVNNTFVAPSFGRDVMHHLLHGVVRNNLFIRDGAETREPFRARLKYHGKAIDNRWYNPDLTGPDWRTDWDDSGYDLRGPDGTPGMFWWFDESYPSVQGLAAAVGIETRGRQVRREAVFLDYAPPTHPATRPAPVLRLRAGSAAVDAGRPLPNLADHFTGKAPDLGAHEFDGPAAHYGPRPPDQRDQWLR